LLIDKALLIPLKDLVEYMIIIGNNRWFNMKAREEINLLSDYLTSRQLIVYIRLTEIEKMSFLREHLTFDQIAEYNVLKGAMEFKTSILSI
jgi:hypothetical protein